MSLIASLPLLAALAFLPVSASPPASGPSLNAPARPSLEEFSDKQVLAAWEKLDADTQEELVEWFRSEVTWIDTFQNGLIKFVLEDQSRDPGLWPILEPLEYFDPEVHAPRQPIKRKALAITSPTLEKRRKAFFKKVPTRRLDSAWVYDYSTKELRRVARLDDPDRLFRNGLNGFRPDHDLAEAMIEMQLDDGSQQKAATVFNHAYTDRSGKVFTGLSLYDALCSGSKIDMPDVDTLGVLHELKNDWKSFKAPVADSKHKKLYGIIADLFEPLHHHRGLRHAMAMTFLTGYPALRDAYYPNLERLHSLWDKYESTPKKLRSNLPKAKKWESFLSKWVKKVDRSKKITEAGITRRDTLHNDGLWVRQKLIDIMVRGGFLK